MWFTQGVCLRPDQIKNKFIQQVQDGEKMGKSLLSTSLKVQFHYTCCYFGLTQLTSLAANSCNCKLCKFVILSKWCSSQNCHLLSNWLLIGFVDRLLDIINFKLKMSCHGQPNTRQCCCLNGHWQLSNIMSCWTLSGLSGKLKPSSGFRLVHSPNPSPFLR